MNCVCNMLRHDATGIYNKHEKWVGWSDNKGNVN